MELMDAGCLTDVLDEFHDVPMSEPEIARICYDVRFLTISKWPCIGLTVLQVLEGLKHMHALNFVHRDIKSDNVLLNSKGEVLPCPPLFCHPIFCCLSWPSDVTKKSSSISSYCSFQCDQIVTGIDALSVHDR